MDSRGCRRRGDPCLTDCRRGGRQRIEFILDVAGGEVEGSHVLAAQPGLQLRLLQGWWRRRGHQCACDQRFPVFRKTLRLLKGRYQKLWNTTQPGLVGLRGGRGWEDWGDIERGWGNKGRDKVGFKELEFFSKATRNLLPESHQRVHRPSRCAC